MNNIYKESTHPDYEESVEVSSEIWLKGLRIWGKIGYKGELEIVWYIRVGRVVIGIILFIE